MIHKAYAITDRTLFGSREHFLVHYRQLLSDPRISGLILREPGMPQNEYRNLLRTLGHPEKLIVHSKNVGPELALALYTAELCTAVHCSERDFASFAAVPIPCSVSIHSPVDAIHMLEYQPAVAFITLSPIFPTSKPYEVTPLGVSALEVIPEHHRQRIIALGGVTRHTAPQLRSIINLGGIAGIGVFATSDWEHVLSLAEHQFRNDRWHRL